MVCLYQCVYVRGRAGMYVCTCVYVHVNVPFMSISKAVCACAHMRICAYDSVMMVCVCVYGRHM